MDDAILDLALSSTGKTAADITHGLGIVGDGKMADGLSRIAEYFLRSGVAIGEKRGLKTGVLLGTFGTITVAGIIKIVRDFQKNGVDQKLLLEKIKADMETVFSPIRANEIMDEQSLNEDSISTNDDKPVEEVTEQHG